MMKDRHEIHDVLIYVSTSGELNDRYIWRREQLYQGMNGRFVERFYVPSGQSYIFKPVTHEGNEDREAWVYKHILSAFPPIYPQLLGCSAPGQGNAGWSVFEDLGAISHGFDVNHALLVAKQMAWWHSLAADQWGEVPSTGQKPNMRQMSADLHNRREEVEASLEGMGIPRVRVDEILRKLEQAGSGLLTKDAEVLSHGDLHLGNYTVTTSGKLYILDWEHAHLNVPYWDLYYLIDMSHPRYPKQMTSAYRERILRYYLKQSAYYGKTWDEEAFINNYCLFAAAFSLWMLMLISNDLQRGNSVWSREELLSQRDEVKASLIDCWNWTKAVEDQVSHLLHNTERAANQ